MLICGFWLAELYVLLACSLFHRGFAAAHFLGDKDETSDADATGDQSSDDCSGCFCRSCLISLNDESVLELLVPIAEVVLVFVPLPNWLLTFGTIITGSN